MVLRFFLVFTFVCLSFYRLSAQQTCTSQEYARFLNSVAATDEQHFYDLNMEEGSQSGTIIRSGLPGSYSYHAREEAAPVLYVNSFAARQYVFWKKNLEEGESEPRLIVYEIDNLSKEEQGAPDLLLKMNRSCLFNDLPSNNFFQARSNCVQEEIGAVTIVAMLSNLFLTPKACEHRQMRQHVEVTTHDPEIGRLRNEQVQATHANEPLSDSSSLEFQEKKSEAIKKEALRFVYRPFSHDFLASHQAVFAKKLKNTDAPKEDDFVLKMQHADLSEVSFFEKVKRYWDAQWCHFNATISWAPSLEYRWNPLTGKKKTIIRIQNFNIVINKALPLVRHHGLIGLNNVSGSCALNAALQTMKVILQIVLEHDSSEQKRQDYKKVIQEKMPQLSKFLKEEMSGLDGLLLQREALRKMTESFWYSCISKSGIALQSWFSGYIDSCDPVSMVWVLLRELKVPPVYFEEALSKHGAEQNRINHRPFRALYCYSTKTSSSIPSMQELVTETLKQEGRVIEEPVPPVLVAMKQQKSLVKQLLAPLTFNLKNGSHVTYHPRLALCVPYFGEKGHAFVVLKKEDRWYEINDEKIFPIFPTWENDLEEYCSGTGRVVVYEKQQEGDASLQKQIGKMKPLEELSIYDQMQHIIQELKQIKASPTDFLNDTLSLIKPSVSPHEISFFLQQAARLFSNAGTLL